MRRYLATAVLFGALGPLAAAENDPVAERIKAHVTFLADDLLEGREAGTRGHEIAARYIASQFGTLGLSPPPGSKDYLQQVPLVEVAPTGASPTIAVKTRSGTVTLKHRELMFLRPTLREGSVRVTAPVVFAGYGMTEPLLGIDDYRGLDVRGKVVVTLWGVPKGIDSEVGAHLQSLQARNAAEHGAVALLAVPTRAASLAFPWEQVTRLMDEVTTTWIQRNGSPYDETSGLGGLALIEPKAAAVLFEGARKSLADALNEADTPTGHPSGFPLVVNVGITAATKVRRFSSPAVIGLIAGSDARLRNEYVVLMAHADHIGVSRTGTGDRINNGALDNAAGVATLLEVARALASAPRRPRRSVLVVANTAEEKGLLGAKYLAEYPPVPIERVNAAIDLDMPLLLYDFTDVVAYGGTHSTLSSIIQNAGSSLGVRLAPDPMPDQAVFVRSDHYPLAKRGVPAVMLATGMANGGQTAWTSFLSTRYHQPSDDIRQPIVWAAGAKFAALNERIVRAIADADSRIQWYEGDYFGRLFAPRAAKAPNPTGSTKRGGRGNE